jgi:hypothetical protein
MRNTLAKKPARQDGMGSDYLFGDFLQLIAIRSCPAGDNLRLIRRVCAGWNDASV